MFGYVRAIPDVLPEEEARRYEAVYCGLCMTLGVRYGWTARFILNYDFVFLALLLAPGETEACACRTCPARPWKKRACWTGGPALDAAADESVILTWWKLKDSLRDGRWWEKLAARTAMVFLKGHYRAAAELRPAFDRTVAECLDQLHAMEESAARKRALELVQSAAVCDDGTKRICVIEDDMPAKSAALLAKAAAEDDAAAILVVYTDGRRIGYIAARGSKAKGSCRDDIRMLGESLSGRGGGRDSYAQGSAPASDGWREKAEAAIEAWRGAAKA